MTFGVPVLPPEASACRCGAVMSGNAPASYPELPKPSGMQGVAPYESGSSPTISEGFARSRIASRMRS